MVALKNQIGFPCYSESLLLHLMSENCNAQHNVVQLISSGERAYVHTAILTNVNVFLCDILSSSCICDSSVLVLPASPPSTLRNFVALLHTGNIKGLSKEQACDVIELAKGFNLDISSELMANDLSSEENMVPDKSSFIVPCDDIDLDSNQKLKIKTTRVSKYGSLTLSFPECRFIKEKQKSN